jgi:hypothetical protein
MSEGYHGDNIHAFDASAIIFHNPPGNASGIHGFAACEPYPSV